LLHPKIRENQYALREENMKISIDFKLGHFEIIRAKAVH
jgi:hypothetical protein